MSLCQSILLAPDTELIQHSHQRFSSFRKRIFHLRRDLRILGADDQFIRFQLLEIRAESFVGNGFQIPFGSIETFTESAKRNNQKAKTKVIYFAELVVDKRIAAKTGFNIGDEIYYLQRLHYLDGKALILNHNYFLKSVAKDLTIEIAEKSIYDYLENTLGVSIVTSKRIMTVEKMTEIDEKYLDLGDYNCMAVVTSHTYNSDGVMFEYTQSRHRPDYFSFQDNATRRSI